MSNRREMSKINTPLNIRMFRRKNAKLLEVILVYDSNEIFIYSSLSLRHESVFAYYISQMTYLGYVICKY